MHFWTIFHNGHHKAAQKAFSAIAPYTAHHAALGEEAIGDSHTLSLQLDEKVEGFRILIHPTDDTGRSCIEITAGDEASLFYAACDLKNVVLPSLVAGKRPYCREDHPKILDAPLAAYEFASRPRIKARGLWSWGHVIYDYRAFIDRMAELKFNTLIIWNDYLPTNIQQVLDYAHENYISVYLGYAWGWDVTMPDKLDEDYLAHVEAQATAIFCRDYERLNCDGIYFQSFTEHDNATIGGVSVAEAVSTLVNCISRALFARKPKLSILFGLHATSVIDQLDAIAKVDPRVSIIWENVGAFPWKYDGDGIEQFDQTLRTTEKIRDLRQAGGFGGVLKGYHWIDWSRFEHANGPMPIGISDKSYRQALWEARRPLCRFYQAFWLKHADKVQQLIRLLPESAMMTCLVEDALFEERVDLPVALYAALLWDDTRKLEDILYEVALHPDVTFV